MKETIADMNDILLMLDQLILEEKKFNWEDFYSDRNRNVPFFLNHPDENLVSYCNDFKLSPGHALDLGCGPGRNAVFLAEAGWQVTAADTSVKALEWGRERAQERGLAVNFVNQNIFHVEVDPHSFDLVYDSGCFHHIPPHRRLDYLQLVNRAVKPGGYFALTCFVTGGELGGSPQSDWDVYRNRSLQGGLGFSSERILEIFHDFKCIEIRKMKDCQGTGQFGSSSLWAALFKKPEHL
ncbi:class I SAM-dependent methyltransferase [Peribacillus kribbensis]|uniref:class I SAM-dependent methyltransferase n=1 Tax=Peribacillus kribbensis TaxID=356658 RepID=UPI0003FCBF52|nr:class I SAM-dependent methyltransferase [Peribacillus kribbensis]